MHMGCGGALERLKMGEAISIGGQARDTVTGYEGTVTAICEYLHGSPRAQVERRLNNENDDVSRWFEVARLEVVKRLE